MLGVFLCFLGTFFHEADSSIVKHSTKHLSFAQIAVVSSIIMTIGFGAISLYKFQAGTLFFSAESIPLLIVRIIAEIFQLYITLIAIKECDRSTFTIIRSSTIPLLFIVDLFLAYHFSSFAILGLLVITGAFFFFTKKMKTLNLKGWSLALFTAVNAVFTISAYKYSISVYNNSFEFDQFIILFCLFISGVLYLSFKRQYIVTKKSLGLFIKIAPLIAISTYLISYSYVFLNASIATAVKRAGEMFWSILFGKFFFGEKDSLKKLAFAGMLIVGIGLLSL